MASLNELEEEILEAGRQIRATALREVLALRKAAHADEIAKIECELQKLNPVPEPDPEPEPAPAPKAKPRAKAKVDEKAASAKESTPAE